MTGMATVQRRVNSVVMIKRIFSGRIILFLFLLLLVLLFLLLLVLLPVTSASSSSSSSALSADGNALLKFKEGITDDPHNMLCNWTHHNLHRFCVDWDGVRCNFSFASAAAASSSGGPSPFTLPRVVSLNLSNFQLSDGDHTNNGLGLEKALRMDRNWSIYKRGKSGGMAMDK